MAKGDRSYTFECSECHDRIFCSVTPGDLHGIPASNEPGWHFDKWNPDLPPEEWVVQHVCKNDGRGRPAVYVE